MDAEKILQDLNRRFAAPLPEFYKRRIVVWIDEDRDFVDKLDEITITGAKVVALNGSNNFYVKKLLSVDDPFSNYLVYRPFAYESDEENWLMDVELYGEEFRADLVSMWMDEMGVSQSPSLRQCFKQYRKFFNAKARRDKTFSLIAANKSPAKLKMSIMAVLAGIKEAKPNDIIKAVIKAGDQKDSNPIYQEFISYGVEKTFWLMVAQGTGYREKIVEKRMTEDDVDLSKVDITELIMHLILTAASATMRQVIFADLKEYISEIHQAYCYGLMFDWLNSEDNDSLYRIAEGIENDIKLPQRLIKLPLEDLLDIEVFPCVNEVILVKLMTEVSNHIIDVDMITGTVEKRRTCVWYDSVKNYYEGLLLVAKMQAFFKEHSSGFHTVEPEKVWKEYTSGYYVMDTWYREFHKIYADSLKNYHEELSDLFTQVMDKVEGLYTTRFLGQLGENWSGACADSLREYGYIPEIKTQETFYHRKIEYADNKIYVIISDALRYEVAASLAEQLKRETKAKVELNSMQGIFPTITKFGMAALLPHKELSVELKGGKIDRLAVLADGQSTESNNRDKILKSAKSSSVALKYKDIIDMKRAERQALIKGMDVIYIYHDTIDEAGHLESTVFSACDEAIEELKNMVRVITKEWGGTNIIITADHGFLYTYKPLSEDGKVDKSTEGDQDVEIGRRYAIMKKGAQPEYLLPVRFLNDKTPYSAFAPRENIRIKMKGGGLNFVHGGISLQEMVVPMIEYHYLRNDSKEYKKNKSKYDTKPVELSLLSAGRKISNMIFSLNFYQKNPVGGNYEAASYQLYFTDSSGKVISDVVKVIADRTSENGQERTFRFSFNLKSMKYSNTEIYYLVFVDENELQVNREEFQIDIAFALDDYDFLT